MTNARMKTVALITATGAVLTGCVGSIDGPQSAAFGEGLASVRAQVVATPVSDEPPETSGQVAAAAVKRYATGKTKPVEVYATSTVGGAGGKPKE